MAIYLNLKKFILFLFFGRYFYNFMFFSLYLKIKNISNTIRFQICNFHLNNKIYGHYIKNFPLIFIYKNIYMFFLKKY